MKSNLLYFDGNGRRARQSFVFLIGVRYPSPSLFVPPLFCFFIGKHKRRPRVRLSFALTLGKSNFTKQKTKQKGRSTVGEWKRHWASEVNTYPPPLKKLHLYIRRPIRHAWLTLIFDYYVYISAFFSQIDCTRFSISYNNNNILSLSLCYWNKTNRRRFSSTAVYCVFIYSLFFLVFCFIVQPVVYESKQHTHK